jgi:hypothetical protein
LESGWIYAKDSAERGSPASGVIVGNNGTILELDNSGNWVNNFSSIQSSLGLPNGLNLNRIFFDQAANTFTIVGDGGIVIYRANNTWVRETYTFSADKLNSCYVIDGTKYVVGDNGRIWKFSVSGTPGWGELMHTYTGGTDTWAHAVYGANNNLYDVYFKDQLTGYICGANGTILKTNDAGLNWQKPVDIYNSTLTTADFHHFDLGSLYTGVIGGGNGNSTFFIHDESDIFSTRFWYDQAGRLILSQNSKQFNAGRTTGGYKYSYTRYDNLGRITEVGELTMNSDILQYINSHGVINWVDYNQIYNQAVSTPGMTAQITKTTYTDVTLTSAQLPGFVQENTRGRVSSVSFDNDNDNVPDFTSYFSYDIHGNVKTAIQSDPNVGYKRIDYVYDLISGNVKEIAYQSDETDAFYHKYYYDDDNRLTTVYTSKDKLTWDKDARYMYYRHGPLARVEIGDTKVQGIDYAYTLQGWIRGINSDLVDPLYDQGKDGCDPSLFDPDPSVTKAYNSSKYDLHSKVANDVYGYSLGYFDQYGGYSGTNFSIASNSSDYAPVSGSRKPFLSNIDPLANVSNNQGSNSLYASEAPNLFNGNIKHMVTTIQVGANPAPMLTAYKYDQLNRIKEMRAYQQLTSSNDWVNINSNNFYNGFKYDANGNINTLIRYDDQNVKIDELKYNYEHIVNATNIKSNRLYSVDDFGSSSTYDITDQSDFNDFDPANPQSRHLNNYDYDELGNLIRDNQSTIENIEWNVYGKIKTIFKTGQRIEFEYDGMGHRISKKVISIDSNGKDHPESAVETYYVNDANGQQMSIYTKSPIIGGDFQMYQSANIYGSSRLGQYNSDVDLLLPPDPTFDFRRHAHRTLGLKEYELTNHLGNVLTTISDRRQPSGTGFMAEIKTAQDYYPFGMIMPGMEISLKLTT